MKVELSGAYSFLYHMISVHVFSTGRGCMPLCDTVEEQCDTGVVIQDWQC